METGFWEVYVLFLSIKVLIRVVFRGFCIVNRVFLLFLEVGIEYTVRFLYCSLLFEGLGVDLFRSRLRFFVVEFYSCIK